MFRIVLCVLLLATGATATAAQDRRPSHCIALAGAIPGAQYLHRASFRDPLPDHTVRISYIAHASFLIQTAGGLSAVTDYTGFLGNVEFTPDVVTMNHAHATHWTADPDPSIPHVLSGWGPYGEGVDHHLDLGEMLIRNVPTDIRSFGGVEKDGNSIFVFEVAGLCIGHLGHLHHEPDAAQYAALGRLDVVMAAVDGGMTLDLPSMMRVLRRLRSSVVIPMHWFSGMTLQRFLDGMSDDYAVVDDGQSAITVSLRDLPRRPTIVVLRPRYLR
ncbi:L-ascorbate metabolism protein UlaG, beta-lactamase superfamily [Salinihabitans flavidus]|uniref:L-ascorbate metabolism protein UlaG, beta-lactamase superfamily n=1 Tax=Salinihabitans flavidus TaxID=569882 RepID=A0A1H8NCB6_9RHOB|nr:MBL fold metallo-hydrolase [Salinihabitans flavidus]SEO27254.1 L-ascorbate metabolism protein UlaG, beta-lactamase superfamily [Salinihabitans flavidus]